MNEIARQAANLFRIRRQNGSQDEAVGREFRFVVPASHAPVYWTRSSGSGRPRRTPAAAAQTVRSAPNTDAGASPDGRRSWPA